MSPRRRVAMPEPGWQPPSRIDATGFRVTVTDEGTANSAVVDLSDLPGSTELRSDLAKALAKKTGPTGSWKRISTTKNLLEALRPFLAYLDGRGITSSGGITVGVWNDFRVHLATEPRPARPQRKKSGPYAPRTQAQHLKAIARLLLAIDSLPRATKRALQTRMGATPERGLQAHYSDDDFKMIQKAAQDCVYNAAVRIRANAALLARLDDPSLTPEEMLRAEALAALMTNGRLDARSPADLPRFKALGAMAASSRSNGRVNSGPRMGLAQAALFLTAAEAAACAVLLMCHEGYNRSVVHELTVPDSAATAADGIDAYRTPTDKPRRGKTGRHKTDILVNDGPDSVGRAMRWIMDATEPARRYLAASGAPTDRLLLSWPLYNQQPTLGIPTSARSAAEQWWPAGVANTANWAMLHRTHVTRIKRQPEHHNRRTFVKEYLLLDAAEREAAGQIIREALEAAIAPARQRLAIRVLPNDAELARGADTAVASCADYEHHPRTGRRCGDSFLLCLECENAQAGPRHFPRIVLLHDAMENLRSAIEPETWAAEFSRPYLNLVAFLREKLSPAQIAEARSQATDEDRNVIERLLQGEFDRS